MKRRTTSAPALWYASFMRVQVLFFGVLKELAGASSAELELQAGATAADLWSALNRQTPALARFQRSVAVAVNQNYCEPGTLLHDGDEVALLPPVSGGAVPDRPKAIKSAHCRLQWEAIDAESIVHRLKRGEDGAVLIFDGVARNHTRGRRTLYLEYEAYQNMALEKLEALAGQAKEQFNIRDCAIVHRLGRIEIGESSVVIVVASAHRAAAFDACRWLIDTLKRTVPIWKKEYFVDGAVWADGDPFPPVVPTLAATPADATAASAGAPAEDSGDP
jgi:molybdopterin synthase catalytic subunit